MSTGISWTEATWNPTTGCDRVSPGCDHCYALTLAKRLKATGSEKYQRDGSPATSGPGFGVTVHEDVLGEPLRWRKPRKVFVNSMSDLFHDEVPDEFLARVFAVMAMTPQHTYQVLTKRHARMRSLLRDRAFQREVLSSVHRDGWKADLLSLVQRWPLPNVWLGVSVEDQKWADIRVPALIDTPAAVRFLSCEPLLGPVDLARYLWLTGASTAGPFYDYAGKRRGGGGIGGMTVTQVPARDLSWVIVGGESGRGARRMDLEWARSLRDQCAEAGVPFWFKQLGTVLARAVGAQGKGEKPADWPEPFPQEFPEPVGAAA
ncbi:phage Gp37/Gp68 family protein [Amycolatopsis thermophila]|uniref:Protein gp37 n=1 Tax=Amycolatopsis thermophila TaxID=206084 RepID=A0ABU0EMV7_9PSEU|nr:phage Gp37/Gp68 family protein [Amycolatopsis thermophila]MDQ0376625.1 protein gp37 [Amycolatopsis thermophila]